MERKRQTAGPGAAAAILLACLVAAGCGGGGSLTMDELPGESVYPGDGSAMLRVNRTLDFGAGGSWELETEFTLLTFHSLVRD
jgi:hypothetical protein